MYETSLTDPKGVSRHEKEDPAHHSLFSRQPHFLSSQLLSASFFCKEAFRQKLPQRPVRLLFPKQRIQIPSFTGNRLEPKRVPVSLRKQNATAEFRQSRFVQLFKRPIMNGRQLNLLLFRPTFFSITWTFAAVQRLRPCALLMMTALFVPTAFILR